MLIKEALCFDDVQILDGYNEVESRALVNTSVHIGNKMVLELPILAAPMNTVVSPELGAELMTFGAGQVYHRYCSVEERIRKCEKVVEILTEGWLRTSSGGANGAAIGLNETEQEVERIINEGYVDLICIDVAACNHAKVFEQIERVGPVCQDYGVVLMVGNFSSTEFLIRLDQSPASELVDAVKVSQGGGSVCTTRVKTGIGKPTFQAVMDLHEIMPNLSKRYHIVADGGLKTSGDIVKAFGAGASMVMLGSVLAGHEECPGEAVERAGSLFKELSGMASSKAKNTIFDGVRNVEGVSTYVPYKGRVSLTVSDLKQCIQSGIATAGFSSLNEFIGEAEFIRVTSAGVKEAAPHAMGQNLPQHVLRG